MNLDLIGPADPSADTNDDRGWQVLAAWHTDRHGFQSPAYRSDHATFGSAYRHGRQLACLNSIVTVTVFPADRPDRPAAIYARADNRWHCLHEAQRALEAWQSRIDMSAHTLDVPADRLSDQQIRLLLCAVRVGGNVQHATTRADCRALADRGLLADDAYRWKLTAAGARLLDQT